ncbi:glycosyltransferase (plasmid) [Tundrisphaera sp. TA3]|uniref:glycosyltransferase n=1 Tax=Tundrisphaera sp. TA3 TaxID=3435775 RepID=UPI003EBE18DD
MWPDPIENPYLLLVNIPHAVLPDGRRAVDQLWLKDLQLHRKYLSRLELASPFRPGPPVAGELPIDDEPDLGTLTHQPVPMSKDEPRGIIDAPVTFLRLWKAVGRADLVHAGIGGWPYPLGWPAALFAKMRGKILLVNVESAPWRLGLEPGARLVDRIRGVAFETMARWCVNRADIALFTQAEYRSSMLKPGRRHLGHVTHASWIDEDVILSDEDAGRAWDAKPASPLRLVFAGRITGTKGGRILIEAIRKLAEARVPVQIDVMGSGDLLESFDALAKTLDGPTTVRLRAPVPYDATFFSAIREYHGLLVPSLADEQPRIIYDAFSQAVPAIASNTAGIRDCVRDGETGILLPPGDVDALASKIAELARHPHGLRPMGLAALEVARRLTHAEMHRTRHALLRRRIDELRPKPSRAGAHAPAALVET